MDLMSHEGPTHSHNHDESFRAFRVFFWAILNTPIAENQDIPGRDRHLFFKWFEHFWLDEPNQSLAKWLVVSPNKYLRDITFCLFRTKVWTTCRHESNCFFPLVIWNKNTSLKPPPPRWSYVSPPKKNYHETSTWRFAKYTRWNQHSTRN